MSAAPGFIGDPFAIRSILLGAVEDYGEAGRDQRFGFGRLDALSSVETAVSVLSFTEYKHRQLSYEVLSLKSMSK